MTNTNLLNMAITKSGKSKREIAKKLGLSEMGLYKKINAMSEFKGNEIAKLRDILNLSSNEMAEIFLNVL